MKRIVKIAVTGGIGSGKSLVLNYLGEMGYKVLSCDEITKKLYATHDVKGMIKNKFNGVVSGNKRLTIDKKKLATQVFSDPKKRRELEDIIHPIVLKKALNSANKVPILFERDYQKHFDGVIVVLRAEQDRINSVMERSSLSADEVKKRISSQIDYGSADLSECYIIENNGGLDKVRQELLLIIKKIEEKYL